MGSRINRRVCTLHAMQERRHENKALLWCRVVVWGCCVGVLCGVVVWGLLCGGMCRWRC